MTRTDPRLARRHRRPQPPVMSGQGDLLEEPALLEGDRDGRTYEPALDRGRLNRQAAAVYGCLRDGAWWTLAGLAAETGEPEASISARLRDLRKPRFGAHVVDRLRVSGGMFAYRLEPKEPR